MYNYRTFIPSIFTGILFLVAYYPAFELLTQKWASSDDYFHAFFIVPVIVYFVWNKRDRLQTAPGSRAAGMFLVVLSLLIYLVSVQLQIPTLIFYATFISLISILIYLTGFRSLKELALPIILLIMIIPIPEQFLSMLTASLQLWISEVSENILRLLSVPMLREGNILHIEGKSFQVVEACSGVRSLVSMTTMSILIGYFTLNTLRSVIILFLLAIPVAIAINILRVILLVLAFHLYQMDLSTGSVHTLTGVVLFALGLLLLFGFQWILELWETKTQKRSSH